MDKQNLLGLLRLHIKRGINLAIRDYKTSDPYIIVTMGRHKLKTRVVKKNLNPEWNEELTLSMFTLDEPILLNVYDKDHITNDDPMGDAEIDIKPYVECLKLAAELERLPDGCALKKIQPSSNNCLSSESCCTWHEGKIVQDMVLKLRNVECGELVVQLEWVNIPGSKGLAAA
ncbi:protein C2-DOMAIN ABA-RELATED 7-like [Argentina anserina]|uniref:protein C2-DOMAIN ABA-RELATED 7-like n=1 Tax=Argentina anserina TaxID=57926 RepID=UPI0021762210|nr:protein C2-DOMAIN ABA-RELATED 7-like [Potentilla anserina]